ncbi:MAG: zinc ABC transporter substrate-binding protein [Bacteroidales bacterium]|nr:zinc ABC transporter substrate-binding protein [Bacteroidales bacterium]NLM93795.1 zinc ABC transporter solute-binding protein [Bacteroidales bacterium]
MNWIKVSALTFFLAVFMAACSNREPRAEVVSVSIMPLQYFVDRLTGEALEVNVMVPEGASHGTYSPTARQMQKLSDSGIYFRFGYLGYEQAFIRRLGELNPELVEVDLSSQVELIRGEAVVHGDHVHEGGIDPHVWMSPKAVLSLMPAIRESLAEVFPQHREAIHKNYPAFVGEIEMLHQEMLKVTQQMQQKRFLIFHPALSYLARDYGLEQVSIEHEGKEPSPAQLSRLIADARAEEIPVIFIQEEYDKRNAELVASETGAALVGINPLSYDWMQEMNRLMEAFKRYFQ